MTINQQNFMQSTSGPMIKDFYLPDLNSANKLDNQSEVHSAYTERRSISKNRGHNGAQVPQSGENTQRYRLR